MSYQSVWYYTKLPEKIIDIFLDENTGNIDLENGEVGPTELSKLVKDIRSSKVGWIPDTNWFCSMVYYYVLKSNRENFLYDIYGFENNTLQYTLYNDLNYYKWHCDSMISDCHRPTSNYEENFVRTSSEHIRKLTVSVQLSDETEYEGGELQIIDESNNLYTAPKEKGSVIIFDSRSRHRVRKIKSGLRKSLVGWVNGPRWK